MLVWAVVHTRAKEEHRAATHLRQQGFSVYFPRFKKVTRHARRVSEVLAPLFPRYLFIRLDIEIDSWHSIHHTRGVSSLVMYGEKPAIVEDSIIEALQSNESDKGAVSLSSLIAFDEKQTLKVIDGSFKGYSGNFEKMLDKDRVSLLLNLLGRTVKVALPSYAVSSI